MGSSAHPVAGDDQALLDRLASRIVELRLELPAILTLETCRPLSLLAGQTKAILIEKGPEGYRLVVRGEAPTTVEAPFEDVTRGVLNAVREVEELAGRKILEGERIVSPQSGDQGVDLYVSTSSAGGGLQMMV